MSNPISYNGVELEPSPYVSFSKNYSKNANSQHVGTTYNIRLTGTLVHDKGVFTDTADGRVNFCALTYKIHMLKALFAENNKEFVWIANASTYLKCYPTIDSIEIQDGNDVDITTYNITMTAPELLWKDSPGNEDQDVDGLFFQDSNDDPTYLTSASESWNIEMVPDPLSLTKRYRYRVTHSLKADGVDVYRSSGLEEYGWVYAKRWVTDRQGYDAASLALMVPDLASYDNYDYIVTTSVDETGGSYSSNESWMLLETGTAYSESFTVAVSRPDGQISVNINGTIKGADNSYANALAQWKLTEPQLLTRCQTVLTGDTTVSSSYVLNSHPTNISVSHSQYLGTIGYSYSYVSSPTNIVSNSIRENVSINAQLAADKYASIAILGRADGPILQDLNTVTAQSISASINILMPAYGSTRTTNLISLLASSPRTSVLNNFVLPMENSLQSTYTQVFRSQDTDTFSEETGQYSRSVQWTFQ